MLKRIFIMVVLVACTLSVKAQDPQFSQFFAAPMYHNPAFTGSAYAPRAIFNFRNQWPALGSNYVTNAISIDAHLDKYNSGVGFMFLSDEQGSSRLKTTEFSGFYSYELNISDEHFLRAGLQATVSNRGFNAEGLIFGDQLDDQGLTGNPSNDPLANTNNLNNINFADFSTGLLYYNPKAYLGISVHHLSQPQVSFLNSTGDVLPRRYTVNGGVNIPLRNPYTNARNANKELLLTPTFLYKQQGGFSQLDFGAYVTYSPLTLGLWYRGIPIKKNDTEQANHDALATLVGFRFDNFSIGYSYDITVSNLGLSTGGAHEVSVSYQLDTFNRSRSPYKRKKKQLSCPKF